MNSTSKNAAKPRGRPFQPGNKHGKGRPEGSRNKATLALEALINGEGEAIVQTILSDAKNGNSVYGKALLDRLVPPRKSIPTPINIPPVNNATDLEAALIKVVNDMATGEITPDEAQAITGVIANHIKLHEALKLEERLKEVEKAVGI